jgi:hypothetical protein
VGVVPPFHLTGLFIVAFPTGEQQQQTAILTSPLWYRRILKNRKSCSKYLSDYLVPTLPQSHVHRGSLRNIALQQWLTTALLSCGPFDP